MRSAQTLAVHYTRLLQERPDETVRRLLELVENPRTPALLRVQLAKLVGGQRNIDPKALEKLLDAANPVPLRQMAAECLLSQGRHQQALVTLKEIARMPNRELALESARIVQECLQIDMGLALGQPLPPPHSPKAADVTRRLMLWAARGEQEDNAIDTDYRPANQFGEQGAW